MNKFILSLFLISILLPIPSGFSQTSHLDTSSLTVVLTSDSPYIYKDEEGYTVVIGVVENTSKLTSVTNIRLLVNFYDNSSSQPQEIVEGGTLVQVIPPLGKSPYLIKSKSPNPEITQVEVKVQKFDSSVSKSKQLSIEINDVVMDEYLHFSGVLKNGPAPIKDANVYLAFYDVFQPPRIVGVSTIPIGDMESNEIKHFTFNEKIEKRSVGFLLISESSVFYSNLLDIKIPKPITKLVTISDVSVIDLQGSKLSEIGRGSKVKIQGDSWIQFSADQKSNETPYTYYVQIKQSGETPFVEFLGKYDGKFIGADKQFPSVDWTPKNSGLYFIETFIWDRNNVPIADKGPIVLVVVK